MIKLKGLASVVILLKRCYVPLVHKFILSHKYTFTDEPCYTIAIYASDSGDEQSGLEYNDTCVGDGGLIVSLDDGIVLFYFIKYLLERP